MIIPNFYGKVTLSKKTTDHLYILYISYLTCGAELGCSRLVSSCNKFENLEFSILVNGMCSVGALIPYEARYLTCCFSQLERLEGLVQFYSPILKQAVL